MELRTYLLEITKPPYPSQGYELIWHKWRGMTKDYRDQLSPSMCRVYTVDATSKADALAKIIYGKGKLRHGMW